MLDRLKDSVATIRAVVSSFDSSLDVKRAAELVEVFAELERLATAGRTLAGRAVERSTVWRDEGFSTPARWMAAKAQTTLGAAVATIETGRRLEELPATRTTFAAGGLSGLQAAEIAAAAAADPSSELALLETAGSGTVNQLREQCRSVIAAADRDQDADERLHRSRYLRHWIDRDGSVRVDAKYPPDMVAPLIAMVDARARRLREQARRAGSVERREAYAADALVALTVDSTSSQRAVVHVHVDEAAWARGRVEQGESCRLVGLGPVSVAAARRLAEQGMIKTVLSDGADVRAVAHLGRTIPRRLRSALEARDQTCVVPDCDVSEGLEIDHVKPLAEGGPTRLDNLARLCRWHHSLKTHRGWQLTGRPGRWNFSRPRRE